jgi:hypothetical protein
MTKGIIELKDNFSESPNAVFKVEFKDGDTFFLSHLKDCSQAAEKLNTWTGLICNTATGTVGCAGGSCMVK